MGDVSLCDACPEPGRCCKRMKLSSESGQLTVWAGKTELETQINAAQMLVDFKLPFTPLDETGRYTDEESKREYVTFAYSCPLLGDDGRCTEYETRPELCRSYQPKQDALCVLHEEHTT